MTTLKGLPPFTFDIVRARIRISQRPYVWPLRSSVADTLPRWVLISVSMPFWVRTMPRPCCFQNAGLGPTNSWRKTPNWYQPNVLPAWTGPGAPS